MDKNTQLKPFSNPLNLIPPVKKVTKKIFTNQFYLQPVKNIHSKSIKVPKEVSDINSGKIKRQTSSVILRSITRKIIHEQYSFFNLVNKGPQRQKWNSAIKDIKTKSKEHNGDKKLIEVIIRPRVSKPKQIQKANTNRILSKRFTTKHSQSTVSFQEGSAKNKHIYFSLRGRKKDKIYEIKTTESDKLSDKLFNLKYGYISKEQIANCKRLIETLNMERKTPKSKRNSSPCRCSKQVPRDCTVADCQFLNIADTKLPRYENNNNHVTVVGRLGQTDANRYILQYATNAATNITPMSTSPVYTSDQNQLLNLRPQRDSTVQTEFCCANDACDSRYRRDICTNRLISQAIQVNTVTDNVPNKQQKCTGDNQITHCICTNTDNDADGINLKECKSPLVIISVYTRQDLVNSNGKIPIKFNSRNVSPQRRKVNEGGNDVVNVQSRDRSRSKLKKNERDYGKSPKSRTPSPMPRNVVKNYTVNKTIHNATNKTKDNRRKNATNRKINQTKSKETEDINQLVGSNCYCHNFTSKKDKEISRKENTNKTYKSNRNDVKKALVDNFLNNIVTKDENLINYFLHIPKENASRVTINIEGKNDNYDVVLEKRHLDTDVLIKKASKEKKSKENKKQKESQEVDSMESFLMLSKEKGTADKEKAATHTICDPKTSNINVQDSLEQLLYYGRLRDRMKGDRVFSSEEYNNLISSYKCRIRRENRSIQVKTKKKQCIGNMTGTDFLAPVKHYRGDDCSISDPNERDKEIRELLGILRGQKAERREMLQNRNESKNRQWTRDSSRRQCSKCMMTGHSLLGFILNKEEPYNYFKDDSKNSKNILLIESTNSKALKNEKRPENCSISNKKQILTNHQNILDTFKEIQETSYNENAREQDIIEIDKKVFSRDEQDISQNLILNRNVQVFLQVEQFSKQTPIKLTKKQYDKLKKVIKSTISRKLSLEKRTRCSPKNCSFVSIGEVKVRPKGNRPLYYNREIQTEPFKMKNNSKEIQTDYTKSNHKKNSKRKLSSKNYSDNLNVDSLSKSDVDVKEKHIKSNQISTRPTVSSMEIRFANVAYMNRVKFSSTQCSGDGPGSNNTNTAKDGKSIHTIFKGFRKTATPNLGTSIYSLCSDISAESELMKREMNDVKPKKPFLRRLISCLVMRSNQISTLKEGALRASPKLASANSSVDSYHISTSLGAFEMSSALYDTSASFYSNHTILPVNKMKRSFFSSVRGFLRNRRGQS